MTPTKVVIIYYLDGREHLFSGIEKIEELCPILKLHRPGPKAGTSFRIPMGQIRYYTVEDE